MKKLIFVILSLIYRLSISAQNANTTANDTILVINNLIMGKNLVHSCDKDSKVLMMSYKMYISKLKLPRPEFKNDTNLFNLRKSDKRHIILMCKLQSNNIIVWLNGSTKHCFKIDSNYKYSFNTYSISKSCINIYGKLVKNDFTRNFALIFYFDSRVAYFDLDDWF